MNKPVIVKDSFYVGFRQFENSFLPVGLDKNSDTSDKIFYKIDNNWFQNDVIKGSLMIRPVFGKSSYVLTSVENQKNKKSISIEGKEVVLVTAIASADLLKEYVDSKANIIQHFEFRDHYNFKKNDINKIIDSYNKIDSLEKLILTTEKDFVKLKSFSCLFKEINLYVCPIEININESSKFDNKIINYVKTNQRNR